MSTRELIACAAAAVLIGCSPALAKGPDLGQAVSPAELEAWDIDASPSGKGLPAGKGTPKQGAALYEQQCQSCHGAKGQGKPNDALAGGQGKLAGNQPALKTVGSYWPYATTIFEYVRRAMPWHAPNSLSNDEVYALTAYILQINGIIGENDTMDAQTLAAVRMPNRDGFKSLWSPKQKGR